MTLPKREARLRVEATNRIGAAAARLAGPSFSNDAMRAALYNYPRIALRRIKFAEAHLRKAKAALRAWSRQ